MTRSTIGDVASLAGVSIKTVSRVFNREPNVSKATQCKVEKAIEKLNYHPDPSARNLASRRARLVVLVYDDPSAYEIPSSGYIINMQQGALKACNEAGFELVIRPCNYRHMNVGTRLRELISQIRPAGIIVAAPLSNMSEIMHAVEESETPFVRLSSGSIDDSAYSIATNDREVSAEMTQYLASLGHQRIAFIKGDERHAAVGCRFNGYRDGLKQAGLRYVADYVVAGDSSIGSGERCGERLLELRPRPTAIFAANDDMAAGVLRAATRRGLDVPGQLSVTGCDDIALAQQVYPALTTIRQPHGAMAETAATALIRGARGKSRAAGLAMVPSTIKVRATTAPPAG